MLHPRKNISTTTNVVNASLPINLPIIIANITSILASNIELKANGIVNLTNLDISLSYSDNVIRLIHADFYGFWIL